VDDVGPRVDLVPDGVVECLGVVKTSERPPGVELTDVPVNLVPVLRRRLVTDL